MSTNITSMGKNGAIVVENDEFRYHVLQDGCLDKETGRRMSVYAGKHVLQYNDRFGSEEITDRQKIERYEDFKREAERLVYESIPRIQQERVSERSGECPYCHTYCYGDCQAN